MRAFLSHSSKDKDFVEQVAELMRPGTYELDATTFDAGLVNSDAIRAALNRSDLFCLFLSRSSVISKYVEFETLIGIEFVARGGIFRFLAVCLDDDAFQQASENVRFFNIVRKSLTPDAVARLIQGQLINASSNMQKFSHPFIGRENELRSLDEQISDHKRPNVKCLYLSGNAGTGRRSVALKAYENHFPHVGRVHPTITISEYDGPLELYKNFLAKLRPTLTTSELRTHLTGFNLAAADQQLAQISRLLDSLRFVNEAAFLIDEGGLLAESGAFTPEMSRIIDELGSQPHPPVTFISPRMVPLRSRSARGDVVFLAVKTLGWDAALRLLSILLKRRNIEADSDALQDLTRLADGHPFNIYQIADEVNEKGVKTFLANTTDFTEWKHHQTSEYVSQIKLSRNDIVVLSLLKNVPELDFDTIVTSASLDGERLADDLQRLVLLHVLDGEGDRFRISPALRVAVERDARVRIPAVMQSEATRLIARSLVLRLEEGSAPVSLVDSAVLAGIENDSLPDAFAAAFLLPSHYVTLSAIRYHRRQWPESIRFGLQALEREARLSANGLIATCRFLCLAAARVGDDSVFDSAIKKLESRAHDDWTRSNVFYLRGFKLRMRGRLPAAQDSFQTALDYHSGNTSAMRELAAIALARGDLDRAETLAREAYSQARTNVYFVDILLTVLIRKHGATPRKSEMDDLFSVMERIGEEEGHSFFTTRRAEYEHCNCSPV